MAIDNKYLNHLTERFDEIIKEYKGDLSRYFKERTDDLKDISTELEGFLIDLSQKFGRVHVLKEGEQEVKLAEEIVEYITTEGEVVIEEIVKRL